MGVDLGIATKHVAAVLDSGGRPLMRRSCRPTAQSMGWLEQQALNGAAPDARLVVVIEPTGPAWLPLAAFFIGHGHQVLRVSSAKAHDLRKFYARHTKTNGIDAEALARIPLADPAGVHPLVLPAAAPAALDRRVRAVDRLTREGAEHKVRLRDLVRQIMPDSPLHADLGVADLAVLEHYADPHALVRLGPARLTALIHRVSHSHQGAERAAEWLHAARVSLEVYAGYTGMPFTDLAEEIATEVRRIRALDTETGHHAAARDLAYQFTDPRRLAATLPGLGVIGAPAVTAAIGDPHRFRTAGKFKSYTGLAPRVSQTGDTDRKGQSMTKAGPQLLRSTLVRAADMARKQDPQLAKVYYTQMVERGAPHIKALCVTAAHLAERLWTTMERQMPYVICDPDGHPVTPAQAKELIARSWTVPEEVRARRRNTKREKKAGKAPQQVRAGRAGRGDPPLPQASAPNLQSVKRSTG
ncbi:IS110 family transposase [Streptacidiphilus albus]|uniref:IS110 family transposase n=1 Tax=Streptacidiphilus albus TaxID=105425 RepID=UPI00054C7E46|nr:IS110 family transposase [Streptacidiphilus albus]